MLNNSQIDKLGDRLRRGSRTAEDLRRLETFRLSFLPAHDAVKALVESCLSVELSSRASKTQSSIVAKLRRSKTRLSRMQDIAGLRLVVDTIAEQEEAVSKVAALFTDHRCARPGASGTGYRAIHVIILHTLDDDGESSTRPVELQVRTLPQHYWAQCSETLADTFGQELKYGGGPMALQTSLQFLSAKMAEVELSGRFLGNLEERRQIEAEIAIIEEKLRTAGAQGFHFERMLQRIGQVILGDEST